MENRKRLLWASFFTLITAGVGFGVRAALLETWGSEFGFTKTELGQITGGGLVGFGLIILFVSLFLDRFGYKVFLWIAAIVHILSVAITCYAGTAFEGAGGLAGGAEARDAAYLYLFIGIFLFAVGNGICEAVINPLVANLFRDNKTHYLNILHAGWPGGLILGALSAVMLADKVSWQVLVAIYLIPTAIFLVMILGQKFPDSEAKEAGVTFGTMLKQFAAPFFVLLMILHAMIGYVELGTDSWISNITGAILNDPMKGLYLFIYTSALMFILRFFAGPIVHRINPIGLLCLSGVFGFVGLTMLGLVATGTLVVIAATIYALGKTFLWPTMLGVVGERFPQGGALTMGAVGGIGMLSAGLLGGPGIGYKQDLAASNNLKEANSEAYEAVKSDQPNRFLFFPEISGVNGAIAEKMKEFSNNKGALAAAEAEGNAEDVAKLKVALSPLAATDVTRAEELGKKESLTEEERGEMIDLSRRLTATQIPYVDEVNEAGLVGGKKALRWTAYVPLTLAIVFGLIALYFKSKGGYKAIRLDEEAEASATSP